MEYRVEQKYLMSEGQLLVLQKQLECKSKLNGYKRKSDRAGMLVLY